MAEGTANIREKSKSPITLRQQAYKGMALSTDDSMAKDAAVLWRITRLIFKYRLRVLIAVFATIAAAIFQLMIPHFLGEAVDNALGMLNNNTISAAVAHEALFNAAYCCWEHPSCVAHLR